jgi:hypothetical protein
MVRDAGLETEAHEDIFELGQDLFARKAHRFIRIDVVAFVTTRLGNRLGNNFLPGYPVRGS